MVILGLNVGDVGALLRPPINRMITYLHPRCRTLLRTELEACTPESGQVETVLRRWLDYMPNRASTSQPGTFVPPVLRTWFETTSSQGINEFGDFVDVRVVATSRLPDNFSDTLQAMSDAAYEQMRMQQMPQLRNYQDHRFRTEYVLNGEPIEVGPTTAGWLSEQERALLMRHGYSLTTKPAFAMADLIETLTDTNAVLREQNNNPVVADDKSIECQVASPLSTDVARCFVEPDDSVVLRDQITIDIGRDVPRRKGLLVEWVLGFWEITFSIQHNGRYHLQEFDLYHAGAAYTSASFRSALNNSAVEAKLVIGAMTRIGEYDGLYKLLSAGQKTGRKVNFAVTGGRPQWHRT